MRERGFAARQSIRLGCHSGAPGGGRAISAGWEGSLGRRQPASGTAPPPATCPERAAPQTDPAGVALQHVRYRQPCRVPARLPPLKCPDPSSEPHLERTCDADRIWRRPRAVAQQAAVRLQQGMPVLPHSRHADVALKQLPPLCITGFAKPALQSRLWPIGCGVLKVTSRPNQEQMQVCIKSNASRATTPFHHSRASRCSTRRYRTSAARSCGRVSSATAARSTCVAALTATGWLQGHTGERGGKGLVSAG